MAFRNNLDRAVETSTITGSGDYTLAGAVAGYVSLSTAGMANTDTALLCVEGIDATTGLPNGGFEIGIYTWNTGATLSRTTLLNTSNGNAAVVWGASTLVRISAVVSSFSVTGIPLSNVSADMSFALTDNGSMVCHPAADVTARTWTIPANGAVAFPYGSPNASVITIDNAFGAGSLTIAITTDTLELVGTAGSTGSRTIASGGQATLVKVAATKWRISGVGVT